MNSHSGVTFETPATPSTVRSPSDLIHLIAGVIIGVIGVLGMVRFFAVFDLFVTSPTTDVPESRIAVAAIVVAWSIGILAPALIAVFAAQRWAWSRLAIQVGGMVLAWFSVLALLDAVSGGGTVAGVITQGWLGLVYIPLLASAVSAVVFAGPAVDRRGQDIAWTLLVAGAAIVTLTNPGTVFGVVTAFGVGLTVGAGLLLVAGTPSRRPSTADLASAMRRSGLFPERIRVPKVDARGSSPYIVTTEDGSDLFVKVVTVDERSADLMFRTIRGITLKDVGDEPGFSSLRRTVEHEAFVSMAAERVGIRTPSLRAGGTIGTSPYSVFLAFESVKGRSLDGVSNDELTDTVLQDLWNQVAIMRSGRIAHRDLRLANVMLDSDGLPWIIDFGFSELAPADAVIDTDVAELIASTSIKVGADRAVGAAASALGAGIVCAAARRMQLPLLSGATRTALSAHPDLHHEITTALKNACDVEHIEYDAVQRFRRSPEQE